MTMELIDDWADREHPAPASAFGEALSDFDPPPRVVNCYDDVDHRWVQVVFDELIAPEVALRLGQALAAVPAAGEVYFNSLRPRAVFFLLAPSKASSPGELPASRYGATLADLRRSWA